MAEVIVNFNKRITRNLVQVPLRDNRITLPWLLFLAVAALVMLAGCGPITLTATAKIPQPLVMKVPVAVALFMPPDFVQYIHKEERWGTDYNIQIGKAQADAISGLLNAMFERVIPVDSLNAGSQLGEAVTAILEPSVEEYAFVTPRDAGSPFFAVSIKYRVNVYLPDGKLADSWGFTGYGTAPAGGLSNTEPLENATALAMRDAGAKLAVEFRDQAIVRGLLPGEKTVDDPAAPAAPSSEPAQESEQESEKSGETPSPVLEGDGSTTPPAQPEVEQGESQPPEAEAPPAEGGQEESEPESEAEKPAELPDLEAFVRNALSA